MASEEPDHPTQAIAPSRDTPEGTDLKQPPSEKHPIQEASSVDSSGRNKSDREVEEAGEVSSQPWHRHRLFKHVRHVVYAVIWLLFTG